MQGKQPINILHEIEIDLSDNMRQIDYILRKDKKDPSNDDEIGPYYKLVQSQEQERQTARFEERKRQRDELDRVVKAQKQADNEKKQTKVVKKVGKKQMSRSEKPRVKHVEKKVEIDDETAD